MSKLHICSIHSVEQEHDFLPATTTARHGGIIVLDVSVFVESGTEGFPTMVFMQNGDAFLIDTPVHIFTKIMGEFYELN